ncbi:LacI family DNA-binding transcriptional regulator [Cohnella candidum]|uniref:LacI family transcriptional regulator n=1 Tax=Cohnella candidum TaxID=2674991 RepID=A0A3G3JZ63_9BACL|nr:LacI family DNA-binding transcriptional regulator [Cohnella candidum]AYQ73546.1 LacI family transcriptional regulator [Cohnella candidum]
MDNKIVDVARRAGVSPATVSRVLNDSNLVTEKTKRKVLQVIEEMDYHPHAAAKQLRSQRTMTIGVIVPDINNSYFAEIIKGVENMAHARKYKVIICDSDNKPEKEKEYLGLLPNRAVDAMILVAPYAADELIFDYIDKGHFIGIIGRPVNHDKIPTVKTNNVKFSDQAVTHLIELGHRSIAYIAGYADSLDSYERMEGYMKAMKEHHIPFAPGLMDNGDFHEQGGYAAMIRLIERGVPFTAVYVANDEMALGVYKACRERNIRIPEDLAVVGVDNNRITKYLSPPLSTVEQPKYAMGALMAEKLIDIMNDNEFQGTREFVIDSKLIIRESSDYDRRNGNSLRFS